VGRGELCKENEAALHAARRYEEGHVGKRHARPFFERGDVPGVPYTWNSIGHLSGSPRFFRMEYQRVTSRASRDPRASGDQRPAAASHRVSSRVDSRGIPWPLKFANFTITIVMNLPCHPRADPKSSKWPDYHEDERENSSGRRLRFQRTNRRTVGFAHFRSDCDRCRRCCGEGGREAPGVNPP
jgi:hypothetical protein